MLDVTVALLGETSGRAQGLPAGQRHPLLLEGGHIPQGLSDNGPESQVVIGLHELAPASALLAAGLEERRTASSIPEGKQIRNEIASPKCRSFAVLHFGNFDVALWGGGVLPSKYFGANADWLRLAVIAHNVLTALKWLALPTELATARPKRLRFLIFNVSGRLLHHARKLILRLAAEAEWIAAYREGLQLLMAT